MSLTTMEQISRINTIETSKKALILIKAIESLLNVEKIVTTVLNRNTSEDKNVNGLLKNIGLEIVDEFRNHYNYIFFEEELKKFCGFPLDDEASSNAIFDCCSEGEVDIGKLKKELIGVAIFLQNQV
ncbi:hypothetical protein ACTSEZ_07455 [Metabacillus sp. JX24]|uniref:hypothetical protein n=1 Tax=Metabacillus sp. JX24 TaxID=3240759 RepID=UPI00350FCD4E